MQGSVGVRFHPQSHMVPGYVSSTEWPEDIVGVTECSVDFRMQARGQNGCVEEGNGGARRVRGWNFRYVIEGYASEVNISIPEHVIDRGVGPVLSM